MNPLRLSALLLAGIAAALAADNARIELGLESDPETAGPRVRVIGSGDNDWWIESPGEA